MRARAFLPFALALAFLPACRGPESREVDAPSAATGGEPGGSVVVAGATVQPAAARLIVRTAALHLETDDLGGLATQADKIARDAGGYVETSNISEKYGASVRLRVPAAKLGDVVDALEKLGDVESREISAEDVTQQTIDLDARLANLVVVRDRLKKHLEATAALADILAVERELARVQTEIDSLEGQLKYLRTNVALSQVSVYAQHGRVLGPVGWVFYGAWWVVSKLFVIR